MRRALLAIAAPAIGLLVASGCGLVYDVDSLGAGGSGYDAAPETGAGGAVDANDAETAAACPSTRGPAMIDAGGICIDATEVTVADYVLFTAAKRDVLPAKDPCSWVTTLEPDDLEKQKTQPTFPIVNVHFCHASLYCTWAEKRLCGRVGGGRVAPGDAGANPQTNEWLRACTYDGEQRYSYGKDVEADLCPGKPGPVATRTACGGAYPGLFDMVGNVGEWVDGCEEGNPAGPQHDACTVLGTEYTQGEASCYDYDEVSRYGLSKYIGFRCCAR